MTYHRSTVWNTIDRIMNHESYSYGLRYFVNDTLHDRFVTNSCNHSGQPRKSSKNVLLYRIQFCGFSNAWHPCIPSHNRHWGSNFRVHRMASNWGLLAYGVAGAFGRQVLQGSDRRWAYYRQVPLSMYKNHQLELSTLVWVTWWCSKNTFALCSCLHLWSFVGIILWYIYIFIWFCFYTHAVFFSACCNTKVSGNSGFCQCNLSEVISRRTWFQCCHRIHLGCRFKDKGVKHGQHLRLMPRSIPITKRDSFHFIPCRLIPDVSVSKVWNSRIVANSVSFHTPFDGRLYPFKYSLYSEDPDQGTLSHLRTDRWRWARTKASVGSPLGWSGQYMSVQLVSLFVQEYV